MKCDVFQIDAFAAHVFAGNPALVCCLDDWPEDGLLRAITAEHTGAVIAFLVDRGSHFEIRYFMSIPEAAQLVLQAALMGKGGEIYVLDMGEPVRIADLARDLIRLSGYSESDIRIEYTGLRPGEKLYEEPLADAETTLPTPHPKLRIARVRAGGNHSLEELQVWLADPGVAQRPLEAAARIQTVEHTSRQTRPINTPVTTYRHQ